MYGLPTGGVLYSAYSWHAHACWHFLTGPAHFRRPTLAISGVHRCFPFVVSTLYSWVEPSEFSRPLPFSIIIIIILVVPTAICPHSFTPIHTQYMIIPTGVKIKCIHAFSPPQMAPQDGPCGAHLRWCPPCPLAHQLVAKQPRSLLSCLGSVFFSLFSPGCHALTLVL